MAVRGENSLHFSTGISTEGLKQGAQEATNIVGSLAGSIGKINPFAILATGAITAFATIASSAYAMMRNFEQAMKEVETISAATQANFKGISAEVFALSKISPDAPEKLAKAYYQIVSAGYDGAAGLKLLETSSKAATAGVTDTLTAADGITTVLNAFKLEASEADEIADSLFQTVKLGKTTFAELSSSLSQAAPLAAATGFSYKELLAAIASLTKQGTPTAQAMTQIRAGIESVSEVLGDGAAKSMTLQNAFQAIYDKAGGSQNKLKELTGRTEAMAAVLGIAGESAEGAARDLEELGNSAGSAEEAFKRMAGSNINEWAILGNRIKATTEDIGNSIVKISSGVAKFLNSALEDSGQLKKSFEDQRAELALLKGALQSATEGSDEYNSIKNKIIANYPDFLSGIDAEAASTEDLLVILDKVNDAYIQRFKYQKRQAELGEELSKQGEIDYKIDDAEAEFKKVLSRLEVAAQDNGIDLNIDYTANDEDILKDVRTQLAGVKGAFDEVVGGGYNTSAVVKGFAGDLINDLTNSVREQQNLTGELKEQSQVVDELQDKYRRITLNELKTVEGRSEAIKQINAAMKASDLSTYAGSGFEEVEKAIEARSLIIEQFREIDQAKNIASIKPFLEDESEEIRKYAEARFRLLNTEFTGKPKGDILGDEAFTKSLKDRKQQYETYNAVVSQIGKEAADKQFASLLEMGDHYGEFLANQLKETTSTARQQAIAVAAVASGFNLNRNASVASTINNKDADGNNIAPVSVVLDVQIDQTSINYINRQIEVLKTKWEAASEGDRKGFEGQIEMWQERLDAATKGTEKEEELYSDVHRALNDMTFESLRGYIDFWKKRLTETEKGSAEETAILGKIADANAAIWQKHILEITQKLNQISGSLRELGENDMADLIDGLSSVGSELETVFKALNGDLSTDEKIAAGVSAAISLADIIISSAASRKAAETDYYNSVIAQQKEYNRLLNEGIRTRESDTDNVFTTDYINQIQTGIDALKDANSSYQDSLSALSEGQAKVGQRNAVDWGNVMKGAAAGAVLGSVVPGIGNVVGFVGGAIVGALAGVFGGKKKKDLFTDLLGEYPDLIERTEDGVTSLNTELAQTLVEQNLVNDATKTLLKDALAWEEQIKAAKEQIAGVVDELAGGLGDNLRNSLVDAFQSGADAAEAMGDSISNVLQDILAQLIFDEIFAAQFKKLQEDMTSSFDTGGDRSWQDDFARFFEEAQGLTEDFNQQLADARDIAQNNGFDIFGQDQSNREGLAGAVTNITEDTANVLAGYMNALRIDVRQGLEINKQSMSYLSRIAINTDYLPVMARDIASMDGRMATVERGILEFEAQG